jgi:hypothetical protein
MKKTTREFLKENGLKFKASYAGLSHHDDPQKTTNMWNIVLSSGFQRFVFEMKTPVGNENRILPPTPEVAMEALANALSPALLQVDEWGDRNKEKTSPLKFGVAYTSHQLEACSLNAPEAMKAFNLVGMQFVESVKTWNNASTVMGATAIDELVSRIDFTPVELKHDNGRQFSPSMR